MNIKLIEQLKTELSKAEARLAKIEIDKAERIAAIEAEGREAADEVQRLRGAVSSLEGTLPLPVARKPVPRRRTRQRASNGTATLAIPTGQVLPLVTAEGIPATDIRSQLPNGATADQVLRTLRTLEDDGHVKRSGQRRSTKWHRVASA